MKENLKTIKNRSFFSISAFKPYLVLLILLNFIPLAWAGGKHPSIDPGQRAAEFCRLNPQQQHTKIDGIVDDLIKIYETMDLDRTRVGGPPYRVYSLMKLRETDSNWKTDLRSAVKQDFGLSVKKPERASTLDQIVNQIPYLTAEERAACCQLMKGPRQQLLLHGRPVSGRFLYVMDESGNFFIGEEKVHYNHNSFMGSGPVAAAGFIELKDGKVTFLANDSGHYGPPKEVLANALDSLHKKFGMPAPSDSSWDAVVWEYASKPKDDQRYRNRTFLSHPNSNSGLYGGLIQRSERIKSIPDDE